jgi:predicted flavoprotein YhiN
MPVPKQSIIMRKEKKNENDSIHIDSPPLETDQEILNQITKRNEENQALKKLLDNLNSALPKPDSKSVRS